jgi:hypothetical protein
MRTLKNLKKQKLRKEAMYWVVKSRRKRKSGGKLKRKTKNKRGGKFNDRELAELTTLLKRIGFTDVELDEFIQKINDISQAYTKGGRFDELIHFIIENHEHDKQGLINWLNVQYPIHVEKVETDTEDTDDEWL